MEIILKENVANVGFKDELVSVKSGYGRNFLIPTGKAVLATESAKKVLAENLKQKAFKEKSIIDAAEKTATKISKLELKISAKVGPDGKLFGSISNAVLNLFFMCSGTLLICLRDPSKYFKSLSMTSSHSPSFFNSSIR